MLIVKRKRKKGAGVELRVKCPLCGVESADINPGMNKWNCFRCTGGGDVPAAWLAGYSEDDLTTYRATLAQSKALAELDVLPLHAKAEIESRGFDPAWIVSEYEVAWDGERMYWPAGRGASRRAVHPWEHPKTLTVAPKGLLGQNRLHRGAHVVLVEGDYKAACIPLPWIGIGIMGTGLTMEQRAILLHSRPASITSLLDSGCTRETKDLIASLLPYRAVGLNLPGNAGKGPDDFPRKTIYDLLLSRSYPRMT